MFSEADRQTLGVEAGTIRPQSSFRSFEGSHNNHQSHRSSGADRYTDKPISPTYQNPISMSGLGKQPSFPSIQVDPRNSDTTISFDLTTEGSLKENPRPASIARSEDNGQGSKRERTQWTDPSFSSMAFQHLRPMLGVLR